MGNGGFMFTRQDRESDSGAHGARSLAGGLLLFSAMVVSPLASAQNVLMLAVEDTGPPDGVLLIDRLEQDFIDNGATVNRLDILQTPGAVSASTFDAAPGPYDFVLVSTVYTASDLSNWNAIRDAIQSEASPAFFMFADGCPQCAPINYQQMIATINDAAPFGVSLGPDQFAFDDFPLNTNSPFSESFTLLDPFEGGFVTYIANTPADNALYLPPGSTPPTSGGVVDSYGFVLPKSQSHGGVGACLFGVVDMTMFLGNSNDGLIAPAFTSALDVDGTCNAPDPSRILPSPLAVPSTTQLGLWFMMFSILMLGALAVRQR
jgi:hypothetical protein